VGVVLRKFLWVGLTAFGAARWANLEAAFVRSGMLREEDFIRDLAVAQTLPGPTFVSLAALCGMRLGGVRLAVAGIGLVLLPGLVAVVLAIAYLEPTDVWVARLFHGILIGGVAVMGAQLWRGAQRLAGPFAAALSGGVLLLIALGAPMVAAVLGVGAIGVIRYRLSKLTLP